VVEEALILLVREREEVCGSVYMRRVREACREAGKNGGKW
jgi:hypothetical protein